MYDNDDAWFSLGCGAVILLTLPLLYWLFLFSLGILMYLAVGIAVIWILWKAYKYIKKVFNDNGISLKKEATGKTLDKSKEANKGNVLINQLDNGWTEEWTWLRKKGTGVTVRTRKIFNEKHYQKCQVEYIPGSKPKSFKIKSLKYMTETKNWGETTIADYSPETIERYFKFKEQNSENLDKVHLQWQAQLDEIVELASHISQLNVPAYLKWWANYALCDNYTAIRSLKNANKIGEKYKNDSTNYGSNVFSGIFAFNDLVKKHNEQLLKLEKRLSYIAPDGTYRYFLDFITKTEDINELNEVSIKKIKQDWAGEAGENAVRDQLLKMDGGSQSKLLTDIIMPFNCGDHDSTTQIDAIYLSRHGIFNIEVKTRTNIKSVKLSTGGNLIINDSTLNSSNSLLEQVSIHHSAIRVLFENSKNKVIQQFLDKNNGKLPIVNVVVIIDENHRTNFTIDKESFESNNIKATNLNGLYQNVISGDYGGYIDSKTLKEMLKVFKDNASYNVNDSNNQVYRNGNLTGKSYSHILFFYDRFREQFPSNDQIKSDIEHYLIFKTQKLKELNEKIDALIHPMSYSFRHGLEKLDGTAFEKQDEAFRKLQPFFDYVLTEHPIDEPFSAIPKPLYNMEYYDEHLLLNDRYQ